MNTDIERGVAIIATLVTVVILALVLGHTIQTTFLNLHHTLEIIGPPK